MSSSKKIPFYKAMFILLALACFFCTCLQPRAWSQWQARIKEYAVSRHNHVLFGEIAIPAGNMSQKKWEEIARTKLWKFPKNRNKILVYKRNIRKMLRHKLSQNIDNYILPASLTVQKGGSLVQKDHLESKLRQFLKKKTAGWKGECKIRDLRLPDHIFLPENSYTLRLNALTPVEPGQNSISWELFSPAGEVVKKFSSSFFLDLWRSVPCAVRPLKRNERISPEKITFKRKNVACLAYETWDGKGGPWRVKRSIGRDQVIYSRSIEPQPLVCKGDKVDLVYQGKMIRLQVDAQALEDAGAGTVIQVINLQSRKRVHARVKDQDTVIIN